MRSLLLTVAVCTAVAAAAVIPEGKEVSYCLVPCTRLIGIPVAVQAIVPAYRWENQWPPYETMRKQYSGPFVTFRRRRHLAEQQFCKVSASMCTGSMGRQSWMPPIIGQIQVPGPATDAIAVTGGMFGPTFMGVIQQIAAARPQNADGSTPTPEIEVSTIVSSPYVIQPGHVIHVLADRQPAIQSPPLATTTTTERPTTVESDEKLLGASYCIIKGSKRANEMLTCKVIEYFPMKDCQTESGLFAVCTADGTETSKMEELECEVIEGDQFMCKLNKSQ